MTDRINFGGYLLPDDLSRYLRAFLMVSQFSSRARAVRTVAWFMTGWRPDD